MSGIASVLSIINGGNQPLPERPYIIPLDTEDDRPNYQEKLYFQYFPDSIQDSKQTNWDIKNIPGLSHPLYQWISGGAREISFTAIFSRDVQLTQAQKQQLEIATSTVDGMLNKNRDVDIPSAIAWLRSFLYPTVNIGSQFTKTAFPKPPRKLILGLPGMRMDYDSGIAQRDQIICIMTQCEVTYEGFFTDGTPRFAKVALQFVETIQVQGKINNQDAFALRTKANVGYQLRQGPGDKKK